MDEQIIQKLESYHSRQRNIGFNTIPYLEEVSQMISIKLVQAVNDKSSMGWIVAISIAILNDFLDILVIGSIPIVGDLIDLSTTMILWFFVSSLQATGPFLGTRIRLIVWGATFFELIPFMDIVYQSIGL